MKLYAGCLWLMISCSCAVLNQSSKPALEILSLQQTHVLPGLPGSNPFFKYTYTTIINTDKPIIFEHVSINDSLQLKPTVRKKHMNINKQEANTFEKGDTIVVNVAVAITDFSKPFKFRNSSIGLDIGGNKQQLPYHQIDQVEKQILE